MVADVDHWLLIGYPNSGKSTFASQMSPEYLVLDLDGRWFEQKDNVLGKYHLIQTSDVLEIVREMDRKYPDLVGKVGTVVVDSGTSVLDYEQAVGRIKVDRIRAANGKADINEIHRLKADMMRVLRGALLKYHCSTIWIFHLEDGMLSGKSRTRATISNTERERLRYNLNAELKVHIDSSGRRGILIEWCRYNSNAAAGQVIWDMEGMWKGTPQQVSSFLRNYTPSCGYTGKAYSLEWLQKFLAERGRPFLSINEMRTALDIAEVPYWYDRAAWGKLIQAAGLP